MKVKDTDRYKLIFSIKKHYRLGSLVEPYIVAYTPANTLSLTYQKIFSGNATYYSQLSESDLRCIRILDDTRPESIVKAYSSKQKIRPKMFFDKYFDKDVFDQNIRPFIDSKNAELLRSLPDDCDQLYLADDINPAFQRVKINYRFSKVLFHLRRNENGTNYFATIKHGDKRIPFMKLGGLMLSNNPAILVVNKVLYKFYDFVEGARLKIFLNRKFVHISKDKERYYYETFVKKLMETSPVQTDGFVVRNEEHTARVVIQIANLENGFIGFKLQMVYGEFKFTFGKKKHSHVYLEWENDDPVFTKVRRSKQWEEQQVVALKALGFIEKNDNEFIVGDGNLRDTIHWISNNEQVLTQQHFAIETTLSKKYITSPPTIAYGIKDKQDWFDLNIVVTVNGVEIPFSKIAKAIKNGEEELVLDDGTVFLIPVEWFGLAQSLQKSRLNANGSYEVGKYQLDVLNHIKSDKIKKHLNRLVDIQRELPSAQFKGDLRPYQVDGLSWLMFLKNNNFGGILADDMGLGKTIQTLAFIQRILEDAQTNFSEHKPILLVAPTSLLFNWKNEAERFTPKIDVYIHSGYKRSQDIVKLHKREIILTSYGLVRNDFELFEQMEFRCIVLDESQYIKNRTAKTSKNIYKLSANYRLALTGTPIENSISDLWSQMHFLNKNLLGSAKQFEVQFAKPIEKDNDKKVADQLRQLIKPFVLRRTKDEVAKELPPITEKIVLCEMSNDQYDYYEEVKSAYRNSLLAIATENGKIKNKLNVLQGLTKLRQISNHPRLIDDEYLGASGKHDTVVDHLKTAVSEGHKVLVFSQFVGYLKLLEAELSDLDIDYQLLTGASTKTQRKKMVNDFQTVKKTKVFLISLKAGGTGLNLTAADYVFIVDPWWNPAAEAQARDRSHRIGQSKAVFTYKFIAKESIEEKIIRLQKRKSKYAKDIILSENNVLKNLDTRELQKLFE